MIFWTTYLVRRVLLLSGPGIWVPPNGAASADREKTAFNTHIGKYEWRVSPMGLCNAPAVLQAEMKRIFQHQLNRFVCVYLDDILKISHTKAEHIEHLRTVLEVLRRHGYKAKPSKCEFFKPELKFLEHLVSANCIRPDPSKVKAVQEWPVPQSVHDIRAFLGLSNYFRKQIQG
jgi:Reverse transcriptase (RNA-dependent DNA polymerase)